MFDSVALGRSVVVGLGDPPPREWSRCERIRVERVSPEIADELGVAWRERRSVTIELTTGLGLDDPEVPPAEAITDRQPWEWTTALDLVAERLHHAVWANSAERAHRSGAAAMGRGSVQARRHAR